ncbi:universal stress protein [Halobacterium litoreum]|uniref:Universal stress protein n=1 Tax=Halobacterium litoreum TaxID=2039234 RepID=A0ABD5NE43_9EURY|nr:universal stress protein [Halobacterium litoreum]UHH13962.1 universal stress protein [Halobacterium litoreum]
MGDLLSRVVLPVASEGDARATCRAALPHVAEAGGEVIAVHVIEKAGGGIDKAGVEQREEFADDVFAIVEDACADAGVPVETDLRFDTDVEDAIFDAARDHDATAVAFTPRGGSRWFDLLTGDHARDIVKQADIPVVVFPAEDDDE